MSPPPIELPDAPRLLVIRLSAMGDTLLTFPAVAALRSRMPDARITFLTDAGNRELLHGLSACDEALTLDRAALRRFRPSALGDTARLIGGLLGRRWDAVVDFQSFTETALVARLSGAPVRIGRHYKPRARRWYTHWDGTAHGDHYMTEANVETLWRAGLLPAPQGTLRDGAPFFTTPEASRRRWRRLRERLGLETGPITALFVGAAKPEKQWPAERFADVAAGVLEAAPATRFLVVAGPGEQDDVARVVHRARRLGVATRLHAAPLLALPTLAAAFEDCRATISNDTGPMHLSVAVGTPTLGIFRWNDPHFIPPPPHRAVLCAQDATLEHVGVEEVLTEARALQGVDRS